MATKKPMKALPKKALPKKANPFMQMLITEKAKAKKGK